MCIYVCASCFDVVEFLGAPIREEEDLRCDDCGGALELFDDEPDRRHARTQSALTFAMRGG